MSEPASIPGIVTLPNGRKYRLLDHGEFHPGEYPTGGIHICAWEQRLNLGNGGWTYVSNAPDVDSAREFLRLAARNAPIEETASQNVQRVIVCAAVRQAATGRIIAGPRHFDGIMREQMKAADGVNAWIGADEGFLDQAGRFLTRKEALVVAADACQIRRVAGNDPATELFSEHLY